MAVSSAITVETLAQADQLWLLHQMVQANWIEAVSITNEFKTEVSAGISGAEQRYGLLGKPIRTVDAMLETYDRYGGLSLLTLAMRQAMAKSMVPLYSDQMIPTSNALSGTALLSFPANYVTDRRVGTGMRVVVLRLDNKGYVDAAAPGDIHVSEVSAATHNSITLSANLPWDVTAGKALVVPLMECRLSLDTQGFARTDRIVGLRLSSVEDAGSTQLPSLQAPGTTPAGMDTYEGIPVWNPRNDWGSDLKWSIVRRGSYISSGIGSVADVQGSRGLFHATLDFKCEGRSQCMDLVRFFESRGGRLHPFFVPSPITVYGGDSGFDGFLSGTQFLLVNTREGLAAADEVLPDIDWDQRPYLAFEKQDGTVLIRRVTGRFQLAFPNEGGYLLTLDTAVSPTFVPKRVTIAYKCRFSNDTMTEVWTTDEVMETSLSIEEVEEEKAITLADIDIRITTNLVNPPNALGCGPTPTWALSDCDGEEAVIYTDDDMDAYEGQALLMDDGTCRLVESVPDAEQAKVSVSFTEAFSTTPCLCCITEYNNNTGGCCTGISTGGCVFPGTGGTPSVPQDCKFSWEYIDRRVGCCVDNTISAQGPSYRYVYDQRDDEQSVVQAPDDGLGPGFYGCLHSRWEYGFNIVRDTLATGIGSWCPNNVSPGTSSPYSAYLDIEYNADGTMKQWACAFNPGIQASFVAGVDVSPQLSWNGPDIGVGDPTTLFSVETCSVGDCLYAVRMYMPAGTSQTNSPLSAVGRCVGSPEVPPPFVEYFLDFTAKLEGVNACP